MVSVKKKSAILIKISIKKNVKGKEEKFDRNYVLYLGEQIPPQHYIIEMNTNQLAQCHGPACEASSKMCSNTVSWPVLVAVTHCFRCSVKETVGSRSSRSS